MIAARWTGVMRWFGNAVAIALAMLLQVCAAMSAMTAEPPHFIGRASCGTATCHGGVSGLGPKWHQSASVWEAHDPHGNAGVVLWNDLSKRIVHALEPKASESEEGYVRVLHERCAGCHAPLGAAKSTGGTTSSSNQAFDLRKLRQSISEGVSCEGCHGPASVWKDLHTQQDWAKQNRFASSVGMLDTESLPARTDVCARCHVGSRSADGLVRDMNHDMIAAGHPAIYLDMVRFQNRLPAHWDEQHEALAMTKKTQMPEVAETLQYQVLLSALLLSSERQAASASAPQPELSEFDCRACHHGIQFDSIRQQRVSLGSPTFHPWYAAGREGELSRAALRMDAENLSEQLSSLKKHVESQLKSRSSTSDTEPATQLSTLLNEQNISNAWDYCTAPTWLDRVEWTIRALPDSEWSDRRTRMEQSIQGFRNRVLGYSGQVPTPFEKVMPLEWDQRDLDALRKELMSAVANESRGNR